MKPFSLPCPPLRGKRAGPLLLICLLFCTACGPRFQPLYEWEPHFGDRLNLAPAIAVVHIEPGAWNYQGRPFRVKSIPDEMLLFRTEATVENVLKGSITAGPIVFFMISRSSAMNNTVGFMTLIAPRYDIILLRREKGAWRTVGDVTGGTSLRVTSGSHRNMPQQSSDPLSKRIVDILLTRGDGATDGGMVAAILEGRAPTVSLEYTALDLLRLATVDTAVVRTAACLQLRDILTGSSFARKQESQSKIAETLGISTAELSRWKRQVLQNGLARHWWHRLDDKLSPNFSPPVSPAANLLKGIALCENDAALGVPPLHSQE